MMTKGGNWGASGARGEAWPNGRVTAVGGSGVGGGGGSGGLAGSSAGASAATRWVRLVGSESGGG